MRNISVDKNESASPQDQPDKYVIELQSYSGARDEASVCMVLLHHCTYSHQHRKHVKRVFSLGGLLTKSTDEWIGLSIVLRPHQHTIGYMGDGFYKSKDPTNSIKVLKEHNNTQIIQKYNKQT